MEELEEAGSDELGWQDEVHVMSDVHVGCLPRATLCTTVFSVASPVSAPAGRCAKS